MTFIFVAAADKKCCRLKTEKEEKTYTQKGMEEREMPRKRFRPQGVISGDPEEYGQRPGAVGPNKYFEMTGESGKHTYQKKP